MPKCVHQWTGRDRMITLRGQVVKETSLTCVKCGYKPMPMTFTKANQPGKFDA